jgi:plasmid stability protein
VASLYIRDIPEETMRALRVKSAQEGISLKALVLDAVSLILNSSPIEKGKKR